MMRKIDYLVIHCSATPFGRAYPPEELIRDHRSRGFRTAGYHYYIRLDGTVVTLRAEEEVGAHVRGYNRNSLGICYEGGLDRQGQPADTRTEEQCMALTSLLHRLVCRYPAARICGHRDLSPDKNRDGNISPEEWIKVCPCFDAVAEYRELNELSERLGRMTR